MSQRPLDERFNSLVEELAKSSHGSAKLGEVKKFLDRELKGTANRESFIRVAPIFPIYSSSKSTEAKQRFGHSLKLSTLKAFPLPKLPSDTEDGLRGYFADFGEPFYIEQGSAPMATPYASMTVTGWHLLNAIIQEKETRAVNMEV